MKINRKMSFFFHHVGRPVIIINKYLDPVTLPYIQYAAAVMDGD